MNIRRLALCSLLLSCTACLGRQPGDGAIDPPQKADDAWPMIPDARALGDPANPTPTPAPVTCAESLGLAPEGFPVQPYGVAVGQTLHDFSECLLDADGNEDHLYAHLGEVVLISMGAGWCPPCNDEAPDIQQLYADYAADGFTVLMSMGEGWTSGSSPTPSFLSDWEATHGLAFATLSDPGWSVSQYYQAGDEGYIPLNVIVDRDGVVVYNAVGTVPVATARAKIADALSRAPSLDY